MAHFKNASSLGVLSRTVVNRNVKREDVDSLPLPLSLMDECFVNLATDRSDQAYRRHSLEPCDCCKFPKGLSDDFSWRINFENESRHLYSQKLPGLATHAEWLELPDRKTLMDRLQSAKSMDERERMQACLNTLRFDETTGLGRVHEWIRRYLYYANERAWFFVVVRDNCLQDFWEAVINVNAVVLPYGCVSGIYEDERLTRNWRLMILAVKNNDGCFRREMKVISAFSKTIKHIKEASELACWISHVSTRQVEDYTYFIAKHDVVFEPMIPHAYWWMLLLIPHGYSKQKSVQSSDLEIQNCVVRFDPLYQCIGDPIESCRDEGPHVYWFDGQILSVKKIANVVHYDRNSFVQWCVSRQMNTLMNLNGNGWFQPKYVCH